LVGSLQAQKIQKVGDRIGLTLFLTFITTFFGFLAINLNEIIILQQFAQTASFGIFANFFITFLFCPAYFSIFNITAPEETNNKSNFFNRCSEWIITITREYRTYVYISVLILFVVFGFGMSQITVNNNLLSFFKQSSPVYQQIQTLADDFSGIKTFYITINTEQSGTFKNAKSVQKLSAIQDRLEEMGGFDKTLSIADYLSKVNQEMNQGDTSYYHVPDKDRLVSQYYMFFHQDEISKYVTTDKSSANIVVRHNISGTHQLNAKIKAFRKFLKNKFPETEIHVTGKNVMISESSNAIVYGQVKSLLGLIVVIVLIVTLLYSDYRAGLLSLIPNLTPVILMFGLIGFSGTYLDTSTAMLGSIAIGIAIDDTIHMMTRYNKLMQETRDEDEALSRSVHHEVVPVLTTSTALALGFLVFTLSSFSPIIRFGFFTACAMLVALVADLVITPTLLKSTRLLNIWDLLSLEIQKDVLEECDLFEGLSQWSIKKVIFLSRQLHFDEGAQIIQQGETGEEMYLLLEGEAYVTTDSKHDEPINTLKPGDVFGEIGVLTKDERSANVTAQSKCHIARFELEDLERIQFYLPYVSSKLFLNISRIIGKRLSDVL
ncbi:MAG: cyclic nucleotide-binding domain-containing protein, partial [bacterium]